MTIVNPQPATHRCRFDMYVVVKDEVPFEFNFGDKGKKKGCTVRGDKFSKDINKWLPFLLKNATKFRKEYKSVELYDNSKPKSSTERIILKMYRGKVIINLLTKYMELFKDYPLPAYLNYEVRQDEEI